MNFTEVFVIFFALVLLKSGIRAARSNMFLSNLFRYPLSIYLHFLNHRQFGVSGNHKREKTLCVREVLHFISEPIQSDIMLPPLRRSLKFKAVLPTR